MRDRLRACAVSVHGLVALLCRGSQMPMVFMSGRSGDNGDSNITGERPDDAVTMVGRAGRAALEGGRGRGGDTE